MSQIKVTAGSFYAAELRDVLVAEGVHEGVAVAVHNGEKKFGYLGHFLPGDSARKDLEEIFNSASQEADPGDHLSAWLGGAALSSSKDADEAHRALKIEAERMLKLYTLQKKGRLWLVADQALTVRLDCATGRVVREVSKK